MCSCQAATGSGSSRRTVARIASQSRATSGSPKTCSAQPGVGKATIVHGHLHRGRTRSRTPGGARASPIARRAARSRPAKRSGSGSPTMLTNARPRSASSSTRWSTHGGVQPTAVVGRELGLRAADVDVEVVRVDPPRALRVGDAGDRPDERRVLDVARDGDVLALLEVHADPEREPRVLLELALARRPRTRRRPRLDATSALPRIDRWETSTRRIRAAARADELGGARRARPASSRPGRSPTTAIEPDLILGIARGGLLVAGALSYALDVKNTFTMNVEFYTGIDERLPVPMILPPVPELVDLHDARMLIADDVADTGPDARARQGLLRRPGRRGARRGALREAAVDRHVRVRLAAHRALDRLPLVGRAARQRLRETTRTRRPGAAGRARPRTSSCSRRRAAAPFASSA